MSEKLVLMYHSISGKENPSVIGSFPIPIDRFIYQIESLLAEGWVPTPISQLHQTFGESERRLYITSDDGTIDWSRNALTWCEKNKIPTHTAVITGPWNREPLFPLTHVIQVKLSVCSPQSLNELAKRIKDQITKEEFNYIEIVYGHEKEPYRRIIKGAFNLIFQKNKAYEILGELTEIEKWHLERRFESHQNYKKFKYAEMGVHTHSHNALDLDTDTYVKDEILHSQKNIEDAGYSPSKYFTLPMQPMHGAKTESLIEPLKLHGYKGILVANSGQWDGESFIIPRVDGIHVEEFVGIPPFRKSSKI